MRRNTLLIGVAILILACSCAGAGTAAILGRSWYLARTAVATSAPTAMALAEPTPLPDTEQAIAAALLPLRESRALAERLRPDVGPVPEVVRTEPVPRAVGDRETFWVSNSDTSETFQVTATLRVISQHALLWVQDGIKLEQDALEASARAFDERIYPTVHAHFGSEWSPGIDGDVRVHILNARFSGAAGYFSSQDQLPRQVNPYSNERELFYMNVDAARPGTDSYASILAHEFQHMVHHHLDPNEDSWVNEGASELATRLCGYGESDAISAYARLPETQLTAWTLAPDEDSWPHYGASYLFLAYSLERLGHDFIRLLVAEPANGIEGFEKALAKVQGAPTFDELYADWIIANLLDDPTLASGRYSYPLTDPRVRPQMAERRVPVSEQMQVSQYGTRYSAIPARGAGLEIAFTGTVKALVVPNTPQSGRFQWWSNRSDMSDMTLTRAFDLRGLHKATLQYSLWYELEDGWDYAYVEVSTDGGAHWTLLQTPHTTNFNPNGTAFGVGYTGYSGHQPGSTTRLEPSWIQESIDLTPYAGREILLRFEVVTDDAVNLPGLCLDDISIPELSFHDDAEQDGAGWEAAGFVRIDNELQQRWLVQAIIEGADTKVLQMRLNASQQGVLHLPKLPAGARRIVLAVSGVTRFTTQPAQFSYSVTATGP
ncbi:MAG: hypothetical protein ACUVX9_01200 [Anaerolineae bacterium]